MSQSLSRMFWVLLGSVALLTLLFFVLSPPLQSAPALSANFGDVVINEVAWMGTAFHADHEWIELYNTTPQAIDLAGWRIQADDGVPNILLTGKIAPHGYYLLERNIDTPISDIPADQVYSNQAMVNTGEILRLLDAASAVVDTANGDGGGWPGGNNTTKHTMERINPYAPDTDSNWANNNGLIRNGLDAVGNPLNGTPRCANSVAALAADLQVAKNGPISALAGDVITYTLGLRNAGNLMAAATLLTDYLPLSVTFAAQTAPYPFAQPEPHVLVWSPDALPPAGTETRFTVRVTVTSAVWQGGITNTLVAATTTTETHLTNNTAHQATNIESWAVLFAAHKTGPDTLYHERDVTYTLRITNTGQLPAADVVITDTLVPGMVLIAYDGTYPLTQPAATLLRWEVGTLPVGMSVEIRYVARATPATPPGEFSQLMEVADGGGATATALWSGRVLPYVRLYALHPANFQGSDESVALINLGPYPISLSNWCLDDAFSSTSRTCFPAGAAIAPGATLWLAKNPGGFAAIWGFEAAYGDPDTPRVGVTPLVGTWPGYTDGGEAAYLLDTNGLLVDALAYGTGTSGPGWVGATVPFPYPNYNSSAQVLYRQLDQLTGLPVLDTDSATDWAQDAADPINGRKVRYPGWDLETLFFPLEITHTTRITLAVAPEGMLDIVSRTIASAQHSIIIEGYSLESIPLYETLDARIRAGVAITIMLERAPAGGMSNAEEWIIKRLHQPPQSQIYLIGGSVSRYRFQHAKFMIIDDRLALISTDNFNESSMPSDLIDNGTYGHRGFVLLTDNSQIVARLKQIFAFDCDPAHHADVIPYNSSFAPPASYVPLPPVDWTYYPPLFRTLLTITATHTTLLQAPEHTLRDVDGLLGLLARVGPGDRVQTMQLNEVFTWTVGTGAAGLNPRMQALIAAAQRGATVEVLLDRYYDDSENARSNTSTCLALNALARNTGLPMSCRMANVTGLGIHAKLFLVEVGEERWVNLGSVNGSENSNKANREIAIQFESAAGHAHLAQVFTYDWERGSGPLIFTLYLPLIMREYQPPPEYPLLTEVFINPPNPDGSSETGREWIEIYNPTSQTMDLSGWWIGDAINEGDYGDGRYWFPAGARLLPQQIIIVAGCAPDFALVNGFNPTYEWLSCDPLVPDMAPVGAWDGFGMALGNTADEVILANAAGEYVDTVAWGGTEARVGAIPYLGFLPPFPTGASLERSPANSDYNDCMRDFRIRYTPRPGAVWTP